MKQPALTPDGKAAQLHLQQAITCLDRLGLHQAAAYADLALAVLEGRWPEDPEPRPDRGHAD